ncbi:transcriptional regulator [Bartonella tribocorum]|nr:transcriptional regulator [Bartonella tribocorum]
MGISQKQLGNHLGVTFQQIQKYEKGLNRVSARCLQEIADRLDVPISFFYADSAQKENSLCYYDDQISSKEEYLLLKNFRILTRKKQKAILQLISDEKNSLLFS